jgi:muconate cycloisomerase
MAATAAAAGIDIWHGSGIDLGLLDASYVHAAACAPTCTLGSDIAGHFIREHHLLKTPLHFADGFVTLPQEPGLGVELDMDAVRRYSRYHWTVETDT